MTVHIPKILTKRHRLVCIAGTAALSLILLAIASRRHSSSIRITADNLPRNKSARFIPRIVHQSWKTYDIPKQLFGDWNQSWKKHNPEYSYILWDDQDNHNLIKEHYPWFLSTYESYNKTISKADAARVFYMHKFGGVYADLDAVCYKNLDPLLSNHHLVLASMWVPEGEEWEEKNSIPNAWFASKPGHSFWMYYAHLMMEQAAVQEGTEELAGPVVLSQALYAYFESGAASLDDVFIAKPDAIFPYSWSFSTPQYVHDVCSKQVPSFNETKCREIVDPKSQAYSISYWSHTWDQ
ncbi:hypothetical protein HDU99_001017 [Rhizoclosmatium hyalinum]|nr:hypothetical protein HDU99_001017 [Rhizoclosmatium hyalinum]